MGGLWGHLRNISVKSPPALKVSPRWEQSQSAPDTRKLLVTVWLTDAHAPLLDVAFGCLITESKLRRREDPVWEETGQGSCVTDSCCCQPYLWPQANPRGPRKSSYPSGGKTNKEQHYKCKLTGHWAWIARKSPPDHAQLSNKEFIGRGTALSPVGEGGSCSWDGHAGWLRWPGNSSGSPPPANEKSISIKEPWVVLDVTTD